MEFPLFDPHPTHVYCYHRNCFNSFGCYLCCSGFIQDSDFDTRSHLSSFWMGVGLWMEISVHCDKLLSHSLADSTSSLANSLYQQGIWWLAECAYWWFRPCYFYSAGSSWPALSFGGTGYFCLLCLILMVTMTLWDANVLIAGLFTCYVATW